MGGYEDGEKTRSAVSEDADELGGAGIPIGSVFMYDLLRGVDGDDEPPVLCEMAVAVVDDM